MEFPEVLFKISGQYFKWIEGYSKLGDDHLLFLQTECNFILSSLRREILTREDSKISPELLPESTIEGENATQNQKGKLQECFRILQNTTSEVNKYGLNFTSLSRHQKNFIEARLDNLKNNFHIPKVVKRETWRYDVYDSMLWLIARYGSFTHALLVLHSIPLNQSRMLELGGIAGIVEYVIQHLESLNCAALDPRASELFGHLIILKTCSKDSINLLSLLVALGGVKLPVLLFKRLRQPQRRWKEQGEVTTITPIQAGIDSYLLYILSEESTLLRLFNELDPWISIEKARDSSQQIYYSVKAPLKENWKRYLGSMQELEIVALGLVCYIFPREKLWEPQFWSDGRLLSPFLDYTLNQNKDCDLPDSVTEEVVECLIAKTRLGSSYFSQQALCEAKSFLSDRSPEYLGAAIIHRQSTLARLEAKYDEAVGGSLAREKDLGGDEVRTVRGGSFILGGQAGSVYSTVYREAIPKTAKLTGTGNSQVLVLQFKNVLHCKCLSPTLFKIK